MESNRFSELINRIQFIGILLALIVVPTVFYVGNQNIVILKPLFAQFSMYFLLALWLIDSLEKGEFSLPKNSLTAPVVCYMLWLVFTILVVSPFWHASIEEMGRYFAVFLLFFLVQKTHRSRSRVKWALWILVGVCIVTTLWGYIQQLYKIGYVDKTIIDWGRAVIVSTFG
ncbi:MAG: hypothetical protein ABEJ65_12975, partial [bacterium]